MRLIDRYVYDVTRRLPEKQREDVALELKTEILEMVDDEAQGIKPTKTHVHSVLRRLGRPAKLADSYRDRPRYIIGPEYYESYIELLKTLLIVVLPIVAFLAFMTQLMVTRDPLIVTAVHAVGGTLEIAIHICFWTTAVFFAVEKSMAGRRRDETKEWTPDELPEIPPKQEITRTESYFGIAWSVFAIIATLFQIPAIHQMIQANVPLFFADELWPAWTLGLLAVSLLSLVAELIKLFVGGWTKLTVATIIVVNSIAVAFFVSAYYLVDPIINPEFIALIEKTFHIRDITQSFDIGLAIFVVFVGVVSVWEMISAVMKYKKGGIHDK